MKKILISGGGKINRILISGGGTGGHIFPALSIANAIRRRYPDADILFVGALGRMEMERVPQAGYPIEGLPVAGFDRTSGCCGNFGNHCARRAVSCATSSPTLP